VVLFAVTGLVGLVAEGEFLAHPLRSWVTVIALMLTAASANAMNMFIDQDIDAIMDRTRLKRSIPLGKRTGKDAIILGVVTGTIAFLLLAWVANLLAAGLSLFTILFYALIYTKWLKRTTHHNTFWGGVAGATAPLIASAAVTGGISPLAWSLFAIIMVWEPPHFWALAITLKDDYAKAKIPMLPVKFGEAYTRKAILAYTIALAPISCLPFLIGEASHFYLSCMVALNAVYIWKTIEMMRNKEHAYCKHLFHVSLLYITWLFIFLLVDVALFSHSGA
jgi:protoheme IX farnesyltransferase